MAHQPTKVISAPS